jgi:hypothetical protein
VLSAGASNDIDDSGLVPAFCRRMSTLWGGAWNSLASVLLKELAPDLPYGQRQTGARIALPRLAATQASRFADVVVGDATALRTECSRAWRHLVVRGQALRSSRLATPAYHCFAVRERLAPAQFRAILAAGLLLLAAVLRFLSNKESAAVPCAVQRPTSESRSEAILVATVTCCH